MWLLDTKTITLSQQSDDEQQYAILSHRWGKDTEEVSFSDIHNPEIARRKKGYGKIKQCCEQALRDGYEYAWVDTCCIDKSSSAELQEAINSMYRWYERSGVCYAYLQDVPSVAIAQSEWFTRGWTLQELLAPKVVRFFDEGWNALGDQHTLVSSIHEATSIRHDVLRQHIRVYDCCIAERMSWAASRRTKRIEDRAYSLFGIFQVHLPMLYGEREDAFRRLQHEILKTSEDDSLFAWTGVSNLYGGLLAPNLEAFRHGALLRPARSGPRVNLHGSNASERVIGIITELIPWSINTYLVILGCTKIMKDPDKSDGNSSEEGPVGIYLRTLEENNKFARISLSGNDLVSPIPHKWLAFYWGKERKILKTPYKLNIGEAYATKRIISIRQLPLTAIHRPYLNNHIYGFHVSIKAKEYVPYSFKFHNYIDKVSSMRSSQHGMLIWAPHGAMLDRRIIGALKGPFHPKTGEKFRNIRDIHFGFDFLFNPVLYIRQNSSKSGEKANIDTFCAWPDDGFAIALSLWGKQSGKMYESEFWNEIVGERIIDVADRNFWAIKGDKRAPISVYQLPRSELCLILQKVERDEGEVWDLSLHGY